MFKEYINNQLRKYFDKHGQHYRIPADLVYQEALHYTYAKKVFEEELKQMGYRVNGGFCEKIKKED